MIPQFPDFKELDASDQCEIESYVRNFLPYSDFNFACLFFYNTLGQFEVSFLHGNLVVKMLDYMTLQPFYTFLGRTEVMDTITKLLDRSVSEGIEPTLKLIPECNIADMNGELSRRFAISEDQDGFDYIYAVATICSRETSLFQKKRQKIKHFRRKHPRYKFQPLKLTEPHVHQQINRLLQIWQDGKQRSEDDVELEFGAIHRCLKYAHNFELRAFGIEIDGTLVAFNISEDIHDSYVMGHFVKADSEYKDAGDVLMAEIAEVIGAECRNFWNYQQDLGIPGLRHSKQSWRPATFLKKYMISARTTHDYLPALNKHTQVM
jgi:hypothetical protein